MAAAHQETTLRPIEQFLQPGVYSTAVALLEIASTMKLTVQLQVIVPPEEAANLLRTMIAFNGSASYAAEVGFKGCAYNQPAIHKLAYSEIRAQFGLAAQAAVRAISKTVDAFARDKKTLHQFRPLGAICYDERIASFKKDDQVSLWTLGGRKLFKFVCGDRQRAALAHRKGQMDLAFRKGKFYLLATCDIQEEPLTEIGGVLGVDMGVVNIATDSDGNNYTSSAVERVRVRNNYNRRRLQKKWTRSARRRLKRIAGRESNFRRNENHRISKELVLRAKGTGRGIALEDLKGIRERTTVRRKDRNKRLSWSYHQLRAFIEYKARLAGVPVIAVDPRNTSRTCNECGHCDKGNRKDQESFCCLQCGHSVNADQNAARNIRDRGSVNIPQMQGVQPLQAAGFSRR